MNEPAFFEIASPKDAVEALDYFNGFHDGFMKRILIASQDQMDEDFGQSCSGVFEVEIDFAHYNYPPGGQRPFNQLVRARFHDVQDIFCELRGEYLGNTIIKLAIVPVNRRASSSTVVREALALQLGRNFYHEHGRRYEYRESQLFTFTDATFRELGTG